APGVAPRLARPGRGPRVRVRGPLAPRPPRPRRRHADRLPRAPRPAARADLTTVTPGELASLGSAALPDEELTASDLERCCFGPGARAVVHAQGAEVGAAAYVVRDFPEHGFKV